MTKAEFVRWAARREDAANSLRDARRSMESMARISGPGGVCDQVDVAWVSVGRAIRELETALERATGDPATKPE